MSENPGTHDDGKDQFDILMARLFSGSLEKVDFLNILLKLDQADPERKSAVRTAQILTTPRLVSVFIGSEAQADFYSLRSLTFFHKAQIRLSEGNTDVIEDLEQSLSDAKQLGDEYDDWATYVSATIAYLKNDVAEVRRLEAQLDLNKSLVQNFI